MKRCCFLKAPKSLILGAINKIADWDKVPTTINANATILSVFYDIRLIASDSLKSNFVMDKSAIALGDNQTPPRIQK